MCGIFGLLTINQEPYDFYINKANKALDLLSNRFNVRRLKFVNGDINLNKELKSLYKFKENKNQFKISNIFSQIKNNFIDNFKVDLKNLVFERTVINLLDSSFEAEELKLEASSSEIEANMRLKNFNLESSNISCFKFPMSSRSQKMFEKM